MSRFAFLFWSAPSIRRGASAHSLLGYALLDGKSHRLRVKALLFFSYVLHLWWKGLTIDLQMPPLHWIMCEEEQSCLGDGTTLANCEASPGFEYHTHCPMSIVVLTRHPDYLSSGCHLTISKDCALSKVILIGF